MSITTGFYAFLATALAALTLTVSPAVPNNATSYPIFSTEVSVGVQDVNSVTSL